MPKVAGLAITSPALSSCIMCAQYWGVFSNVGDIMSTVGVLSAVRGSHLSLFEYLHGIEHPHGAQKPKDDIPHGTNEIPPNVS